MKVYILIGSTWYEGDDIISVHSDMDKALSELGRWRDSEDGGYDSYDVQEYEVQQ
jgi:hypothetical protein